MRLLITILLLLCTLTVEGQTSLYIVGTVHTRTNNFNSDSILNILTRIKPDLILLEIDSSFFGKDLEFKAKPRTNETMGVKKYISKYPTPVRPYDVKLRYLAINATTLEEELLDRLGFMEVELDTMQRQVLTDVRRTNKELVSFLNKRPLEINQRYTYELVAKNQMLMYQDLLEIVESRQELNDLRISLRQSSIIWDWRNKKMKENTLTFLSLSDFKNKTIVLFTGFFHKYFLLEELLPEQERYGFLIKEYYQ